MGKGSKRRLEQIPDEHMQKNWDRIFGNVNEKIPSCVTLYNADCVDVIGEIKTDVVITDPPFGSTACHWDQHLDWPVLWPMLWDSLGEDGVIALHSANPFTHPLIASQIQNHKYSWIWTKNIATNFFHAKRQPLRAHEEINVFYRKCGRYYPQMSEGHKPTQSAKGSSVGQLWHGTNKGDYAGGVTTRYPKTTLDFAVVDPKCRIHPSQKPVDLLEYLVRTYTREGETVLDFSMGSGSTAIACLRSGRKFIGIERDTEIFNTAKERIISWQNTNMNHEIAGEENL